MRTGGSFLMMDDALRNMKYMMECLKDIPSNETLTLGKSGGFCVSTRTEAENWVCFPGSVNDVETVRKAAEFFRERGESFMWPVFDGGNEILSDGGLIQSEQIRAMTLDSDSPALIRGNDSVTFTAVTSREDSARWAKCTWRGFDYDGANPSEDFCAFAWNLAGCEDFGLYVAGLHGRDSGAFLTVNDDADFTGVYYFSVVPEMRREGIASAMMDEIRRLSHGKKIVLQAEAAGVPFYSAYGFRDMGGIEVYSG